ncbi:MAG: hypothetical protein FJ098_07805, partial [Deltaproteobacteria bacterium]|nr:hypothetical protein [Deltaproteobacteria bacterium]
MAWIRKIPQRWLFITAIASVVAVAGGIGYNLYQFFLADEIQRSITGVQVPLEHASSPYPLIETLVAAKAEAAFQDAEAGNSEIKAFHAELEGRFRRLRVDLPGICREAVLEDGWQAQLADRGLQTDLAAGLLCRADDEALRTIDPGPEGLRLEAVTVSLADPDAPPSVEMTTFVFRDKSLPSEQEAWLVVPATLVPQAGTNGAAVLPPRLTRSLLWTVVAGRTLVTEGAALASARKEQAERLTSFYFMDLNGILYFQNPDLWLTVREFAQELGRSPLVTLSLYSRSIRKNVGYRRTLPYLDSAGRGSVVSHFSFLSFSAPSGLPLGGLLAVDEQVEEASDRMAELVLWPARQAGPLRRYSSLTLACPDNQESVIEEPEYDGLRVVEDGGLHAIACAAGKDTKTRIDRFSRLSSLFLKRTESVFQELKVPKDEVVLDATPTGATHRLITIPLGDKRIQCFLFPLAEPRYAVWLKVALPWAVPLLLLFVLLFILIKMQKSLRSTIRERDRTVAERNRALADTRDLVTS